MGYEEESEILKFEDDNFTLKATMEDLIAEHSVCENAKTSQSAHFSNSKFLRLPTIQPLVFDGKLENWSSFIDTFNALFHYNPSLSYV